jgi:hypothetical protein
MQIPVNHGLHEALNKRVFIMGFRYNFAGIVSAINSTFVTLTKAVIVFDSGDFKDENWAQAESPKSDTIHVAIHAIESWVVY